jgi:hypothetical protein
MATSRAGLYREVYRGAMAFENLPGVFTGGQPAGDDNSGCLRLPKSDCPTDSWFH